MSRIGKRILKLPENVNVAVSDNKVEVSGPKGSLTLDLVKNIEVIVKDNEVSVYVMIRKLMKCMVL